MTGSLIRRRQEPTYFPVPRAGKAVSKETRPAYRGYSLLRTCRRPEGPVYGICRGMYDKVTRDKAGKAMPPGEKGAMMPRAEPLSR